MSSQEIRKLFLEFFKKKGHAIVLSSSLIPDDPSVLLTTAGMQQFKRYYTGELNPEKDFGSRNTTSVQKSFRTSDIDEVGDDSHLTFFEMLGNFSFGGYFKKEAIEYGHDFITKEMGLKIDYVSVFEGDKEVPADSESEEIWKSLGVKKIKKFGRKDNFWGPTGSEGPCGPTTEIYVQGVEIWNIVFNEYYQNADKTLSPLKQKGVDTGMGLERLAMVSQGKKNIFETDLFEPLMYKIKELAPNLPDKIARVFADHVRGSAFLICDGLLPSNKEAGYILRRLLRRVLAYKSVHDVHADVFPELLEIIHEKYGNFYKELKDTKKILGAMEDEKFKFEKALSQGLLEIEHNKIGRMTGISSTAIAFKLYETYGMPLEVTMEMAPKDMTKNINKEEFERMFKKHQEISRAGQVKKFGGHGLILNTGELKAGSEEELKKVTRLHTATHLLHQALRDVLGDSVHQMGSDITTERTRFDFTFGRKLTKEEVGKVEEIVNKKVKDDLPVAFKELPKEEAEKTGALHFFKEKYPDMVKVYYVGKSLKDAYSKEFCGGPHVTHTGEIGKIKIAKEEAVGAGTRRIRAVVE
ncbi:MAG: alanine--tRNA ligase [Patescibacteria group bacterium]